MGDADMRRMYVRMFCSFATDKPLTVADTECGNIACIHKVLYNTSVRY